MTLHCVYRESSDPQTPHPRTMVPYRVRLVLGLDDFFTRLAFMARRIEQSIRR